MNSNHQEYSPISTTTSTASSSTNGPKFLCGPSEKSNPKVFVQQGIPVASVPPKNSYLQINEFELPPFVDKLEAWNFVCYKYWILVSMAVVSIMVVGKVLALLFFGREPWIIVSLFLCSWHFVQSTCIYEGISKRNLEYIENGIHLMKLYSPGFWICIAVHSIEVIEMFYARHFYRRHMGELVGLSLIIASFIWGLFYFLYMYGAFKVKEILTADLLPQVIPNLEPVEPQELTKEIEEEIVVVKAQA